MSNDNVSIPDENAFNSECPICLSGEGKMTILSCLHKFHEECLENHTDLKCPQCRQDVVNWTEKLREKLLENYIKFRKDIDDTERENIIRQQRNARLPLMYIKPPPQIEIITALQYLQGQGIPMRYLCQKIKIKVQKDRLHVPGQIFAFLVNSIKEQIEKDIEEDDIDYEESDDGQDPFEEENSEMENMGPQITFVDMNE